MEKLKSSDLGRGVTFHSITDSRFKTNRLSLHFVLPMELSQRSSRAILPFLWVKSCADYPDMTKLSCRLAQLYGASLSAKADRIGGNQVMSIAVTGIDDRYTLCGEAMLKECAELLIGMALRPALDENGLFSEEDVKTEQKTLSDTLQAKINDKRQYASQRALELLLGEQDGADPYGTPEQVASLTAQAIAEAYRTVLRESEIHFFFVGCGDAACARRICENAFASVERSPVKPLAFTRYVPAAPRTETERMDVAQAKLALCLSSGLGEKEEPFTARMLALVLGGTPSSKFFLNVREKLSLCYYCSCRLLLPSGVLLVSSGVEQENIEAAKAEILRQIDLLKNGELTDEELKQAAKAVANACRTVGDSPADLEAYYLRRVFDKTLYAPDEEAEILIAVTREQVIAAAQRLKLCLCYTLEGKSQKEDA